MQTRSCDPIVSILVDGERTQTGDSPLAPDGPREFQQLSFAPIPPRVSGQTKYELINNNNFGNRTILGTMPRQRFHISWAGYSRTGIGCSTGDQWHSRDTTTVMLGPTPVYHVVFIASIMNHYQIPDRTTTHPDRVHPVSTECNRPMYSI